MKANYAINPTPELDLRSNRALLPARVIAVLDVMKPFFAVLVLGMASSPLVASDDVLAPCTPMPHGSRLRALVMRGVDAEPIVTFTVIPSFDKEYGWSLYRKQSAFVLRFVKFRTPVWSDPGWTKPRAEGSGWIERHMDVRERAVEGSFASQISELVERELALVESRPDNEVTLDGVTYEVTKSGKCGEAWSPEPGSRMDEFVEMVEELENVASAGTVSERTRSESKVGALIRKLPSPGSRK